MLKIENTPVLYTKRLVLRKFTLNDLNDVYPLYSDKSVNRFLPWFAHASKEETEKYLKEIVLPVYEKPLAYCYAVQTKEENSAVGCITVNEINETDGSADLGYALKKEYWNKGIMTEAALSVVTQLKNNGFRFLTATHDVNNPGSGEVMKKIGMRYCFTYTEQWQPKDISVNFRLYLLNLTEIDDGFIKALHVKHPLRFIENIN